MALEHLNVLLKDELVQFYDILHQAVDSQSSLANDVIRYTVDAGGKRIRPKLLLLAAKLCGYTGSAQYSLAAALEFIHTATLLHDDVVDDAHLRRNQESANIRWNNTTSILVGDYLYSRAFMLLNQTQNWQIQDAFARTTNELAEGELLQLAAKANFSITTKAHLDILAKKTGSLFGLACSVGGILSGCDKSCAALDGYGRYLGLAFQIIDDVLDLNAQQNKLGKHLGSDIFGQTPTLPILFALKTLGDDDARALMALLDKPDATNFGDICYLVDKGQGGLKACQKAAEFIALAKESLRVFPELEAKKALLSIAEHSLQREL